MTESHTAAPAVAAVAEPPKQLLFDGSRKPLFWLLLRNLGLTIVTLGIYRFWAKTRVRQFFWRHPDRRRRRVGAQQRLFPRRGA